MTVFHPSHRERIDAGLAFEWDRLPETLTRLADVPADAQALRYRREGRSHRGLGERGGLRRLWASAVNQEFLEEIARLPRLETLHLAAVTATDLSPLSSLPCLSRLTIVGATKVTDLAWAGGLAGLRSLGLEHLPAVHDLAPLAGLSTLTGLAIEGSLWTPMLVATLAPLAGLGALEALFLTNLRVDDGSLQALRGLEKLRTLHCAKHFGAAQFQALAAARPGLACRWFDGL